MPRPAPNPAQQLTDRARKDLLGLVDRQITGGLADLGNVATDFPGFVAGPPPQVAAFSPLYGITRAACRSWARGFGPQQLPGFDAAWSGICGPYLGGIGEAPTDGAIAPPFVGGQCPGIRYTFEWTRTQAGIPGPNGIFDLVGPLRLEVTGDSSGTANCPVGQTFSIIRMGGADNTSVTLTSGCDVAATVFAVYPTFGGPNDCGDPDYLYRPPTQAPNLPPLPTQPIGFPGIGPIGVDVTFGPDGEIIIDFPDIDGTVTVPNPFAPGGDDQAGGTLAPGAQGTPGTPQDVAPGDAAEGENTAANLTGVLVQTIEYPPRVNRLFNPTESYTKGAYYVYLGGDAGLALIDTAAITRQDQFYPAPPGCNRFRVVPNAGFTIRVTPFFED